MGVSTGIEAVKDVKTFIDKVGLNISRVPPKIKKRFIELANEDFVGDYGMCLKYLIDIHDGVLPTGIEQTERAEAKADEALNQIQELKSLALEKKEEEKVIKMVNGNEVKR